jgi:hypothetical protein
MAADRIVEAGVAERPFGLEPASGDLAVVELLPDGALIAAVDALGHGPDAARAAGIAGAALREFADEPPEVLVRRCHETLGSARGVALSLASFSASRSTITWLGVGNVEGRLLRTAPARAATLATLTPAPGTVGEGIARLAPATHAVARGDTIVFATDGIRRDFADSLDLAGTAQAVADRIIEAHGRDDDDGLVVVARLLGGAP